MFKHKNQGSTFKGFTLIELAVVVAIVGIVAAIAMPAYLDSMRASHRTDAQMTIQRVAMSLERFYTTYGKMMDASGETYNLEENFGNSCVPRVDSCNENHPNIRYFIDLKLTTATYTIRATPKHDQLNDKCGTMTVDQTNTKTVSGANVNVKDCW